VNTKIENTIAATLSSTSVATMGNEMTRIQIELVRSSFAQVVQMADAAGALFYRRLFELDPSLRSLFRGDLREQGRKLIQMLGLTVAWLDRPDMLLPTVESLGHRHELYGVKPRDYQTVGEALLWTLAEGLGQAFTNEVRDAWIAVFELISTAMQKQPMAA